MMLLILPDMNFLSLKLITTAPIQNINARRIQTYDYSLDRQEKTLPINW